MLRAIWLTVQNEARLLIKDPIVLFMLLLAPVVIVAVAGYSLGSLYGGVANSFRVPLVDLDHGKISEGIIKALRNEHSITLEMADDPERVRRMVTYLDRTPVGIEIPAGTSAAAEQGGHPRLILFVDPVRRVEVNALELRIGELCRMVAEQELAQAQKQINEAGNELAESIRKLSDDVEREQTQARSRFQRTEAEFGSSLSKQIAAALKQASERTETLIRARENGAWADVQKQLSQRQAILTDIQTYLTRLRSSQRDFKDWFAKLAAMAGEHARDIPQPPAFPPPPPPAELAQLAQPIVPPKLNDDSIKAALPQSISIKLPKLAASRTAAPDLDLKRFESFSGKTLPGSLDFFEQPSITGEAVAVNAFDQYVPGFGVTFLLIGMMLGIALTLFDERQWGTLKRLRACGAPLTGLLMGKLIARFIVGTVQMVLLFAVGWALFRISLGRQPLALLIPTVGISFASAALGLVIASIARAHDSVMPLGTVVSMAMAAIGGCWWPLDFEPAWMRAVAQWMPTTWAMEAFNNLMIRNLPASSTLWPFAATVGLGMIFLVVGIFRLVNLED
ncbi:MAG: ABC transporter permease [Candidatus Binataceae bacterium]|jgi:ABC-type multidrug transport system permease subunit